MKNTRYGRSIVLVTGATGSLGPQIVETLHHAGYSLRVLASDPPEPFMFPSSVDFRLGDINDEKTIRSAMAGTEFVFHMAALLHILSSSVERLDDYKRVNVDGTASVVKAAVESGVQRLIFFSTISVYGPGHGRNIDENTHPQPNTPYALTKLHAERIVLGACCPNGHPLGTVLRLASVYGPRIKGNYRKLVRALEQKRLFPVGKGHNRRTLIYEKDVARAAFLAMKHPTASGKIYNVSDGQVHSIGEVIETISIALGINPPRFFLPEKPARIIAGLLEDSFSLFGWESPITRATVDKFTEDIAVTGKRIQDELGFLPQYSLRKGWQETIQIMRQEKK